MKINREKLIRAAELSNQPAPPQGPAGAGSRRRFVLPRGTVFPSNGEPYLDVLAELLQVRLLIHGHHYESTAGSLAVGSTVRGLERAEPWWTELPGTQ